MGPIFLGAPLAWAPSSLRWPHSWFLYLVVTAHPALTASATLRAFPTLALFAVLTTLATLATCPALAASHIQFSLPNFVTPGPQTSLVTVFAPCMLGMFPGWGRHWYQPVEGSWLICIVLHQVGRTVIWLLFGRNVVGAGGPSPLWLQMAVASGPLSVPGYCSPSWPVWLGPVSLTGLVLCRSKTVLTAQKLGPCHAGMGQRPIGWPAIPLCTPLTPGTPHLS